MSKRRILNNKSDYISRSKIGTKNAEVQVVSTANRKSFEVRPDGYFIWRNTKKSEA